MRPPPSASLSTRPLAGSPASARAASGFVKGRRPGGKVSRSPSRASCSASPPRWPCAVPARRQRACHPTPLPGWASDGTRDRLSRGLGGLGRAPAPVYWRGMRAWLVYRGGCERLTEFADLTTQTIRLAEVVRGRQATRVVKR